MKLAYTLALSILMAFQTACQNNPEPYHPDSRPTTVKVKERAVGGPCECCQALIEGVPEHLVWETQISPKDEPGEPLEITGTIFQNDGKTPAGDIILYVYHTDAKGNYSNGPNFSECAKRHGHLRGWIKTGPDGKYKFKTIRPASYPNSTIEQHIHPIVKEPGLTAYWIDEFLFDDDAFLNKNVRSHQREVGGNGILTLHKNEEGIWVGNRDIILGKNVSGY